MGAPLPMFPLSNVTFPGGTLSLHVFEQRYLALVAECLGGAGEFGVVLISRGSEVGGGDERVDLGTLVRIVRVATPGEGRLFVEARGLHRIAVEAWLDDDPFPRALVVDEPSSRSESESEGEGEDGALAVATSAVLRLRSLVSELGTTPLPVAGATPAGEPVERSWQLCDLAPLGALDRQHLLAASGVAERMTLLAELCRAMADDVVALLARGG